MLPKVLVVLIGLSWCSWGKRLPTYFITGPGYKSYALNSKPFKILQGENGSTCGSLCAIEETCWAYAISCASCPNAICYLYNTNMCRTSSVDIKNMQYFQLYDRREFPVATATGLKEIRMTCKQLVTLRKCLSNNCGRCEGCQWNGWHGDFCQYRGSGCPGSFQFSNGTCYNLMTDFQNYTAASNSCSSILPTSSFATVHVPNHNAFLGDWLRDKKMKNNSLVYIGLQKFATDSWLWADGNDINKSMPAAWARNEPNGAVEDVITVRESSKSVIWHDSFRFPSIGSICRSESVFNETSSSFYCVHPFMANVIGGGCYYFNLTQNNFTTAISNCKLLNSSMVCVASIEDQTSLEEAFAQEGQAENISYYIGVQKINSQWQCLDGTLLSDELLGINGARPSSIWASGEPNVQSEMCAAIDIALLPQFVWRAYPCFFHAPYSCEYMAGNCNKWMSLGHKFDAFFYMRSASTYPQSFLAKCIFNVRKGLGWTVIQMRRGKLNFERSVDEFESGFYATDYSEYWIGNHVIAQLTNPIAVLLRIELISTDNTTYVANYDKFQIFNGSDYRILSVGNYSGNASDGMVEIGAPFRTIENGKCDRSVFNGGWWITNCSNIVTNLNGKLNYWIWNSKLEIIASKMMIS